MNEKKDETMTKQIKPLQKSKVFFIVLFGLATFFLMIYYLSNTIIHFTTTQQFPINSFERFPLTILIFPAEFFSFCFALYFVYVLLQDREHEGVPVPLARPKNTSVAILLPVYNEPEDIVERTLLACKKIRWPGKTRIYILDDSDAQEEKKSMDRLARRHGCVIIRRDDREGYKAGNINNGLKKITEQYFVILDSDQAPSSEFLERTMDYFSNPKVAFVQTPQDFVNHSSPLERSIKIGTDIFYRAQCVGKSKDGSIPFCGTNAVVRTEAFWKVGGFTYFSATEDIELGLRFNQAGYIGTFVPEVLVRGYAPQDFSAYSSQQYRWANGNIAILRESWRSIFFGRFSFRQQMHTLFTLSWWFVGIFMLIYIIVPILSLVFSLGTHHTWLPTMLLVILYFNVTLGVLMIYLALHGRVDGEEVTLSDALLQYLLITNSIFIFLKAGFNAAIGRYVGFVRTNKRRTKSGFGLIKWNLILSAICFVASFYALFMAGISSDAQQLRTYLPVSLWLLFYGLILVSSIIFVGDAGVAQAAEIVVAEK